MATTTAQDTPIIDAQIHLDIDSIEGQCGDPHDIDIELGPRSEPRIFERLHGVATAKECKQDEQSAMQPARTSAEAVFCCCLRNGHTVPPNWCGRIMACRSHHDNR